MIITKQGTVCFITLYTGWPIVSSGRLVRHTEHSQVQLFLRRYRVPHREQDNPEAIATGECLAHTEDVNGSHHIGK
jgi:hypothetical protein